jgi:hypothetical protein
MKEGDIMLMAVMIVLFMLACAVALAVLGAWLVWRDEQREYEEWPDENLYG